MKNFIYSKQALMMAKKADGNYYPFACVEEVSLHVAAGVLETTTVGSGEWDEFVYSKKKNWEGSLKGVAILEDAVDNCWTQPQIFSVINSGAKLELKFFLIDTDNRMITYTGSALLIDQNTTGSVGTGGEPARWDIKLKGSGALVAGAVGDKIAYVLNEQGGKQLLEDGSSGAILQG